MTCKWFYDSSSDQWLERPMKSVGLELLLDDDCKLIGRKFTLALLRLMDVKLTALSLSLS